MSQHKALHRRANKANKEQDWGVDTPEAPEALRANWLALASDSPNAGIEPESREGPANLRSGLRGRPGAGQPA